MSAILSEKFLKELKRDDEAKLYSLCKRKDGKTYHIFKSINPEGKCKLVRGAPSLCGHIEPKDLVYGKACCCRNHEEIRIQVAILANEKVVEICGTCVGSLYKNKKYKKRKE